LTIKDKNRILKDKQMYFYLRNLLSGPSRRIRVEYVVRL